MTFCTIYDRTRGCTVNECEALAESAEDYNSGSSAPDARYGFRPTAIDAQRRLITISGNDIVVRADGRTVWRPEDDDEEAVE